MNESYDVTNNAGYTATPVACGTAGGHWAAVVIEKVAGAFREG